MENKSLKINAGNKEYTIVDGEAREMIKELQEQQPTITGYGYIVDETTDVDGYLVGDIVPYGQLRDIQAQKRGKYFIKNKLREAIKAEFIGDSIFDSNEESTATIAQCYSDLYAYVYGPNLISTVNHAYTGNTTDMIYNRTETAVNECSDITFIHAGINDALYYVSPTGGLTSEECSIDSFALNLKKLLSRHILRGSYVIYCIPAPMPMYMEEACRQDSDTGKAAQLAKEYGRVAKKVCESLGVPVFDSQLALAGYKCFDVTTDGMHLTDAGKNSFAFKLLSYAIGRGAEDILHIKDGDSVAIGNLDQIGAVCSGGAALTSNVSAPPLTSFDGENDSGASVTLNTTSAEDAEKLARIIIPIYCDSENLFIVPHFASVGQGGVIFAEPFAGAVPYINNTGSVSDEATKAVSAPIFVIYNGTTHEVSKDDDGLINVSNALLIAQRGYHLLAIQTMQAITSTELLGFDVVKYSDFKEVTV